MKKYVSFLLVLSIIFALQACTTVNAAEEITWKIVSDGKSMVEYEDIIWDGKQFVAVSWNSISVSTDGLKWTQLNTTGIEYDSYDCLKKIVWSGSVYACISNNYLFTSKDLKSWTKKLKIGEEQVFVDIACNEQTFIALLSTIRLTREQFDDGKHGWLYRSNDNGISWELGNDTNTTIDGSTKWPQFNIYNWGYSNISWSGFEFVFAGEHILTTKDGKVWLEGRHGYMNIIIDAATDGKKLIALLKNAGSVYKAAGRKETYKSDRIVIETTMIKVGESTGGSLLDISDGEATAESGFVDKELISQSLGSMPSMSEVEYTGGMYAVIGYNGTMLLSEDLKEWEKIQFNGPDKLKAVASDGNYIVVAGDKGYLLRGVINAKNTQQTSGMTPSPKNQSILVKRSNVNVLVNGKKVGFDAYSISGNNYFKLRDIAMSINGSDKQVEVTWDANAKAINLISGKKYTSVGGELVTSLKSTEVEAAVSESKVLLDGKEVTLTAYSIGGNNYFKLRDIGKALDFGVVWDGPTSTIGIDTTSSYIE